MFTGPSGAGKTTVARIIKKLLGCDDRNFFEYNTSNTRGIDTIRDISSAIKYIPLGGGVRIILLDECHKLTNDAQNALLKVLEDPPHNTFFILCTTDPEKMLKTIHTRCSVFHMSPLIPRDMGALIMYVCTQEQVSITKEVVKEIIKAADGSPRRALVLLDQVIDLESEETALAVIAQNYVNEASVKDIIDSLLSTSQHKWEEVSKMLQVIDKEPEEVRRAILEYMATVLLNGGGERMVRLMAPFLDSFFNSGRAGLCVACYMACQVK
jgi:DNA polymerase-3 subunit gamma/tau